MSAEGLCTTVLPRFMLMTPSFSSQCITRATLSREDPASRAMSVALPSDLDVVIARALRLARLDLREKRRHDPA